MIKIAAAVGGVALVAIVVGLIGLFVAVGMLRSVMRMVRTRRAMQEALLGHPADRWAVAATGLWTGGEDSAGWDASRARESLGSWYGATDPGGLRRTVAGLRSGATDSPAWDQVRAIDLLRMGVAAGYLSPDDCRVEVAAIASDLRERYSSWEALAGAFEEGMNGWQDMRGITDESERTRVRRNVAGLRAGVWTTIGYRAAL